MGVKLIAKHRHTHYAGAWVPYTLIHLIDYLLVYLFDGTERKIGKKRRRRATNTFEAEVRDTPITGTQVPVFLHGGDPQEAYTMPHDISVWNKSKKQGKRKQKKK